VCDERDSVSLCARVFRSVDWFRDLADGLMGRTGWRGSSALLDGGVEGKGIAGIAYDGIVDIVGAKVDPTTEGAVSGFVGLFREAYCAAR